MEAKEERCNHKPWILLTVLFVVGAVVVSVVSNRNIPFDEDAIMAHQYVESPSKTVKQTDSNMDLQLVSQEIGEKESQMEGSLILSDGAETEEQQIEMDRAAANEAERDDKVLLMNEKEDGEELDTKHITSARHIIDNQDVHLELLSEEELPAKHLKGDYSRRHCHLFRRCYATFCQKLRCTKVHGYRRVCKRKRVCRGYGLLRRCRKVIRCHPHHYSFPRCYRRSRRCGKICRLLTLCNNNVDPLEKFNFLCYNRYCARRYCARECSKDVKICKRYRRCYRRCVGECGKKDTQCVHKCYNYQKCHHLNKCYDRCFIKREVCGNRCVHKTTSSSEDLTHYGAESKGKRYGETSGGNKKKKHSSSSSHKNKKKSAEKKKGKAHSSGEKKHPEEPKNSVPPKHPPKSQLHPKEHLEVKEGH